MIRKMPKDEQRVQNIFLASLPDIYRILGILFLGLTLSPDIPRDKVSPKNKMPNILFIGNL
jgi:hypothetical protein